MIVRVLTARVPMDRAGRFNALMRTQLPLLREYEGLVYVKLARRLEGAHEEVVLLEEWRDPESMYAWTGPELEKARLVPGAEELIEDLRITHFEALDIDPADDG
jgi:quinol monooxygenase YgiN